MENLNSNIETIENKILTASSAKIIYRGDRAWADGAWGLLSSIDVEDCDPGNHSFSRRY